MKPLLLVFGVLLLNAIAIDAAAQSSSDIRQGSVAVSPLPAWPRLPAQSAEATPPEEEWWETTLLYIPNRVLDFIDIFRVDVGVGGAFGGVARLSRYAQVGYRSIAPASIRVGAFGRELPVLIERSSEFGAGPAFFESKDRNICDSEVGVGADLGLGLYVGFCAAELFDFFGGLFLADIGNDDLHFSSHRSEGKQ